MDDKDTNPDLKTKEGDRMRSVEKAD